MNRHATGIGSTRPAFRLIGLWLLAALLNPFQAAAEPGTGDSSILCRVTDRLRCHRLPSMALLWQRDDIEAPAELRQQDGRLWITRGRQVFGFELATGHPLFRFENDHLLFAPRAGDSRLFLADQGGWLRALETDSGRELWRRRLSAGWIYPPALDGTRLYTGGSNARVTALDASSGEVLWELEAGQELVTYPLLAGGLLWISSFDAHLQGLDPKNGRRVVDWSLNTPLFDLQVSGNRLVGADYAGRLQAFDLRNLRRAWSTAVAESQQYRFVLVDDRLAVATAEGQLLLLDADRGRVVKRIRFETEDMGQALLPDSTVWLLPSVQPMNGSTGPIGRPRPASMSPGGEP